MMHTTDKNSNRDRIIQAKVKGSQFNISNSQSFRDMVKYITSLKNNRIIDDEIFSELILYSCSIFIENQIEEKVSRSISNVLFTTSSMMDLVKFDKVK